MNRISGTMALALAISTAGWGLQATTLYDQSGTDPYKPKPRSKGEKARNRKFRRGAKA